MESEKFTEVERKTENRKKGRAVWGEIGTEYRRKTGSVHRQRMNEAEEVNIGRKKYEDA